MPLDPEELKGLIVTQLGQEGVSTFEDQVSLLWELNDEKRFVGGLRLQYLYTLVGGLELLESGHLLDHDYSAGGVQESWGQVPRNIHQLAERWKAEILALEARGRAGRSPKGGQITAEQVYTADGTQADPNGRVYRGDPLVRTRLPR